MTNQLNQNSTAIKIGTYKLFYAIVPNKIKPHAFCFKNDCKNIHKELFSGKNGRKKDQQKNKITLQLNQ